MWKLYCSRILLSLIQPPRESASVSFALQQQLFFSNSRQSRILIMTLNSLVPLTLQCNLDFQIIDEHSLGLCKFFCLFCHCKFDTFNFRMSTILVSFILNEFVLCLFALLQSVSSCLTYQIVANSGLFCIQANWRCSWRLHCLNTFENKQNLKNSLSSSIL